jgi:hypothetical protein
MAIYGDTSGTLSGHQKGKGQLLQGSDEIYGDAYFIEGQARAGSDELIANGGGSPYGTYYSLYGDAYVMRDQSVGGNDVLIGGEANGNYLYGDAFYMSGFTVGGNDRLTGGHAPSNYLVGDASTMSESAKGGRDTIIGGDFSVNELYGDALRLEGNAIGGADTLRGGDQASHNYLYGDAVSMTDHTIGGDDTLTGGSPAQSGNFLWGDAKQLIGPVHGGDDSLTGGYASINYLYGDGDLLYSVAGGAVGGNDTLYGGDHANFWASGGNYFYGDGAVAQQNAVCGNDRLVSGLHSNDHMWGDGDPTMFWPSTVRGSDTFVFAPMNGQDTIYDFEQGRDHIELTGFKHLEFSDFDVHPNSTGGVIIDFHDGNTITVLGVASLTAADFII